MKRNLWIAFAPAICLCAAGALAYDPESCYETRDIEGWTVHVNHALLNGKADLATDTLKVLEAQLLQVRRAVPEPALSKLREVPIWVEAQSKVKCMCYHPSVEWLRNNGFNPAKAKSVELGNPKSFLDWTKHQFWMVFHELAHAYHDRILGWDDLEIKRVFQDAVKSGKYESVLKHNGKMGRHYALNNQKEFFAEMSEAYLGTNDFYPFVRAELQQYDPEAFDLLKSIWEGGQIPSRTKANDRTEKSTK